MHGFLVRILVKKNHKNLSKERIHDDILCVESIDGTTILYFYSISFLSNSKASQKSKLTVDNGDFERILVLKIIFKITRDLVT